MPLRCLSGFRTSGRRFRDENPRRRRNPRGRSVGTPMHVCLGAALALGLAPSVQARPASSPLPLPSSARLARSTAIVQFHERRLQVRGGFVVVVAGPAGRRRFREERGVAIAPGPVVPPSRAERRAGLHWRQLFWFHARAVRHRAAGSAWGHWERPGDVPVFGCLVRIWTIGRKAACIDVPPQAGWTVRREGTGTRSDHPVRPPTRHRSGDSTSRGSARNLAWPFEYLA